LSLVAKRLCAFLVVGIVSVGCGGAVARTSTVARAPANLARWTPYVHVSSPIDVVGPRPDGEMVVAANGRLWLLSRAGDVREFASTYHSNPGLEAYVALASPAHPGCSYGAGTVYAISFGKPRGVVSIAPDGVVRPFASIAALGLIDGIAFDETGTFGSRLLVVTTRGRRSTVDAINCHGAVRQVTASAHRVEGGIAVAPMGLPHGPDTGVESEAFVPAGRFYALLADRLTPGNPHPGDNVLLRAGSGALFAAGVRPGDLLDATEGGAKTVAVRCGNTGCAVLHVADGPAIAHAEGHIAIVR
jgi:hypothetical protein